MEELWGYFSQNSIDEGHGSSWWRTPDGRKVEVTYVSDGKTLDEEKKIYQWPDLIQVGMVVEYLGAGRTSKVTPWLI
jgi:hypothetical protein